jgi:hypothetical protein
MNFLKTFRLGVAAYALPVILLSSTVGQDGAVLLYKQNYSEAVSFSRSDAPLLRDFYVVLANSPKAKWHAISGDVVVAPFQTPSLSGRYSGSFIVDTTAPRQVRAALQPTGFDGKMAADTLRLYVGRSKSRHNNEVDQRPPREAAFALVDSRLPLSALSFVRFDIKEWEVLDSVLSYNIDVSFWGRKHARGKEVTAGLGS